MSWYSRKARGLRYVTTAVNGKTNSSFVTQRFHGMDLGCAKGGNCASGEGNAHKKQGDGHESERIGGAYSKQQAGEHSHECQGRNYSNGDTYRRHFETFPKDQAHDITALGANGHSDSNFAGSLSHRVGHHPIKTNHRKQKSQRGERSQELGDQSPWRNCLIDDPGKGYEFRAR